MATITIDGDAAFRASTEAALEQICPCRDVTVNAAGVVSTTRREPFCTCYCRRRAGCNLIQDLVSRSEDTRIVETTNGNSYSPSANRVRFNPDRLTGGLNARGDRNRPPSVGLAHELIHAQHDHDGVLGGTVQEEEFSTVRGENQIRREMCEPRRTHYGDTVVPDATSPNIDETDQEDCNCGGIFRSFVVYVIRWWCWLRLLVQRIFRVARRLRDLLPGILRRRRRDVRDPFSRLLQLASPRVAERLGIAARRRAGTPEAAYLASLAPAIERAEHAVRLEAVDLDGAHAFFLLIERDGTVGAATNRVLAAGNFTEPGDVREFRVEAESLGPAAQRALRSLDFAEAAGGEEDLFDGTAHLVAARHGAWSGSLALYGYEFAIGRSKAGPPEGDDADAYRAVAALYEAWLEFVGSHLRPDAVIPQAEVGADAKSILR